MEWLRGGEARARRDWGREGHDGTPGTRAHRGDGWGHGVAGAMGRGRTEARLAAKTSAH